MSISVVVVSYNVRAQLESCLRSLPESADIIVVDNASADDSVECVQQHFPRVRLLALDQNLGFGAAVNRGVALSNSDAILLLNPDAYFLNNALSYMQELLQSEPSTNWLWGFRQINDQGIYQLSAGPTASLVLDALRGVVQRRLDRGDATLASAIDRMLMRPLSVPWVAASACLIRRQAFEKVNGFDERYFLYFEDIDLCLRMRQLGGHIIYDPRLTVVHGRGASARTNSELANRAYRESQVLFWKTHGGFWAAPMVQTYLRILGRI